MTQEKQILKDLEKGKSITALDALKNYGSPFFYGQKVTHKLNGTAGIITIKGQKYNAGQTWRVRFERADRFEEIEVWEWEIIPENDKSDSL
jgi:hypothetical protein